MVGHAQCQQTVLASLVLENDQMPPFWRQLSAAAISPSTGFNRWAFGDRFDAIFASHDPVYYSRLQLGFSTALQNETGASATNTKSYEALADYSIDYGLPGKPGYTYHRPFDYFSFQATASSANGFENLMTRGLLLGSDYGIADAYRGIWGLYGSYDYLAPQLFRVSSTALSLGTTGQLWLSNSVALQGTLAAGVRYAAVGTVRGIGDRERRIARRQLLWELGTLRYAADLSHAVMVRVDELADLVRANCRTEDFGWTRWRWCR